MIYECSKLKCSYLFSFFIVFIAFVFAMIEIEIEGKHGWGKTLHTTHLTQNKKSLTIYHVLIFVFVFSMFQFGFFIQNNTLTIPHMLYMFSMTLMFFFLEDIIWFILNPHHSIFNKSEWHATVYNIPLIYIVLPTISFTICCICNYTMLWLSNFAMFLIGLCIIVCISPLYNCIYTHTHKQTNFDQFIENQRNDSITE